MPDHGTASLQRGTPGVTRPFKIQVQEIYCAPQGEGPNMGRPSVFLRVHGCPLSCRWCDTSFTWDKAHPDYGNFTEYTSREELVDDMLAVAHEENIFPRGLVLTGGEPLMYQYFLPALITLYQQEARRDIAVEVETAGVIIPSLRLARLVHFNMSHKLATAGNERVPTHKLWSERAARVVWENDGIFKPVVGAGDDHRLNEYLLWMTGLFGKDVLRRIYLMPEGQTRQEVLWHLPKVMGWAQFLGTNYTVRAHILAYDKERRR